MKDLIMKLLIKDYIGIIFNIKHFKIVKNWNLWNLLSNFGLRRIWKDRHITYAYLLKYSSTL